MANWLILGGILLILVGVLVGLGVPLGKLPGDIYYKGENTSVYIPITTSILISVVISLLFWLFSR